MDDFRQKLTDFENRVILQGVREERWGTWTEVTIRPGKQARRPIGKLLGTRFYDTSSIAIDYYGLVKKSTAFMSQAADIMMYGPSTIFAPLVSFASIKVEDVHDMAPDLVEFFVELKKRVLEVRFGKEHVQGEGAGACTTTQP